MNMIDYIQKMKAYFVPKKGDGDIVYFKPGPFGAHLDQLETKAALETYEKMITTKQSPDPLHKLAIALLTQAMAHANVSPDQK